MFENSSHFDIQVFVNTSSLVKDTSKILKMLLYDGTDLEFSSFYKLMQKFSMSHYTL